MANSPIALSLHRLNAKVFRRYDPNSEPPLTAAAIATAHEIVKTCIARLAPDEDAVYDDLVSLIDAFDGVLEHGGEGDDRPSAAEKARVDEIVRTFTAAGSAHDEAAVRDALQWARDYVEEFWFELGWRACRLAGV